MFINPLSWLKSNHKIHNLLLEKHIIWLLLWDSAAAHKKIKVEIPISLFLLQNIDNSNKLVTNISVEYSKIKYKHSNCECYLDKSLSIPLGFFSQLLKL